MKTLQIFEYQKLIIGSEYTFKVKSKEVILRLESKYIQALWRLYDSNRSFFKPLRNGICFQQFVGVIKVLDLTIEVLPKADLNTSCVNTSYRKWQSILIDMLRTCKHLETPTLSDANLNVRANSILDLYINRFIEEIKQLVRAGLIRRYRKVRDNSVSYKGRLLISRHIQKNSAHQERFFIEHEHYDKNHLLHRILLNTISFLPTICTSQTQMSACSKLLFSFPEVDRVKVTDDLFDRIVFDRKTEPYRHAIQIAKMLSLNYRPDISSGLHHSIAILFDMNRLWEEYVYQMLKKSLPSGVSIHSKKSIEFWRSNRIKRRIIPDIIISSKGKSVIVIDTKWKVITDKSSNIHVDDLRQMYAYNHYFEANSCFLLYPGENTLIREGAYSSKYFFGEEVEVPGHCGLMIVKAWKESMRLNSYLDSELGLNIYKQLGLLD